MDPRLAIVLVSPQGPANIGAAARAMKNFGITDLRLVDPVPFLNDEAFTWACDAKDLLRSARVCTSLDEALADLAFSAAFTRRLGRTRRRHLTLSAAAPVLARKSPSGGAALVFGREDAGLANHEIARCDAVVEIPTSAAFPSINLAQSVMLACYETTSRIRSAPGRADGRDGHGRAVEHSFVPREEIAPVIARLEGMLASLGYEDEPGRPLRAKILDQLERLFGRAGLTRRDLAMLEGLICRIRSKC